MSVSTKNRIPSSGLFVKKSKTEESMSYHNSFINIHEKPELNRMKYRWLMRKAGSKLKIREIREIRENKI